MSHSVQPHTHNSWSRQGPDGIFGLLVHNVYCSQVMFWFVSLSDSEENMEGKTDVNNVRCLMHSPVYRSMYVQLRLILQGVCCIQTDIV